MRAGAKVMLPCGSCVRYIDHLGSDHRIVEAARVSYDSNTKGEEKDRKLLNYLLKHRHTSPFEQCSITFEIYMPVFVMRQFVRHRTFRLNEVSARYTQLGDDFYIPSEFRKQDDKNKQGSVATDEVDHVSCQAIVEESYDYAYTAYTMLLEKGVAKEQARIVLPVGIFTKIYVNCDLHNLMHFLGLRLDSHAQQEIRDVAVGMFLIMEQLYPWTARAFSDHVLPLETVLNIKDFTIENT